MFVSATDWMNDMIGAKSRSKRFLNGNVVSGVRPTTLFQPARCGTRSPPVSTRVTNTTSASPHQRRVLVAFERSAHVRA